MKRQEDDKMKKSSSKKDTIKVPEKERTNSSNMPNSYAKVKNTVKGEEELQDGSEQDYGFIDEFLEEAVNISNIYESQQETDYDYWTSEHTIHTSISINNTLYNKCMNLLFLPEKYHISILDGCADTCVLGKGWEILSIHSSRRANVVGFDHETAIKRNLPIVSAITALDLPNGQSVLLLGHEGIYNKTSSHSLLSEFQLREFGIVIDSICHRHGAAQQMIIKDSNDSAIPTIPLDLAGCMVHFKHRLPTVKDVSSLKQYCLTHGETPWNPSSLSDQMADKFYQQVIDTESYNTCLDPTARSQTFSFNDLSDSQIVDIPGQPAYLVFHADTVQKTNIDNSILVNAAPHYSTALPSKTDYERLSPYFAFRPHDVIQHTLRQTTQLANSTVHYPMRRHLKSRFQMLRHKRLNEVIATDTYFSSTKSLEGFYCAQVFFGMTSKMLYVAGMKTESEFPDVYLDFIRQHGIPSALRRDNAKSEMSQRVCQIHRDLVFADQ
jgi:hypothetical protein